MLQTTSHILMLRPSHFGFNEQTSETNVFQKSVSSVKSVAKKALTEFDNFVQKLRDAKINVIVFDDSAIHPTPDSIFPNNWISFHENGRVVLYPMLAENRRLERRPDIIHSLETEHGFKISEIMDLSYFEKENRFLEGTGSMVLDRVNKIAYAAISPRTSEEVLKVFCEKFKYKPIILHTHDKNDLPIYHTNVMMCVGENFAVLCTDIIKSGKEKVISSLKKSEKEIIKITIEQMNHFAGNMLQVENTSGKKILIMSKQTEQSLSKEQIRTLSKHTDILYSDISTIEQIGGGSVRCMMAEIFCKKRID